MFIDLKYSGYNRHGEQSAVGRFLILMQPDTFTSSKYPHYSNVCKCGLTKEQHASIPYVHSCDSHGIVARLKARKDGTGSELNAICDDGERYVSGCEQCQAHKAYMAHCHTFSPVPYPAPRIRAIVRYVRMRQLGHFMMGSARIGSHRITLSGSYGSDGLPKTVPDEVYESGIELPDELYQAWNNGGGWNGAGLEAPLMREWARKTFPKNAR